MAQYPPIYLDDIIKFGKYGPKNSKVKMSMRDVINRDWRYVQWMIDDRAIDLADDAYSYFKIVSERS